MDWLHEHVTGVHMLHLLTGLVPLAALLAAAGAIPLRRTLWLVVLAVAVTAATFQLGSLDAAGSSTLVRFGAPLPYAHAPIDASTGELLAPPRFVRAYLFADALFWASIGIVTASLLRPITSGRATGSRRRPGRAAFS